MDEDDLDLNDDSQESDAKGGDSGSGNSAPPEKPAGKDNGEARINDLMSKWQTEQARANRLQAELDKRSGGAAGDQGEGAQGGESKPAAASEFEEFIREDARRRIFESDPRLAAYGLEASAISGSTVAEMKASFEAQRKLVDGIATRVRGEVLSEHGLVPDVSAGAREEVPSIERMSDDEFAKFLEQRDVNRYR